MGDRILDSDFLKKLQNISLAVRMPVSEGASGVRKSKAKGSSVEFSDFREYSMGDDFRKIDWNAYGRFDKFFVKLFMEEREATINIFIDSSKSMDFGQHKKSNTSIEIAAVLAFLSLNNSDRVCINNISESGIQSSKSMMGRNMFNSCINFLENISFKGRTSLNTNIKKKQFACKGVSIIISDFLVNENIGDVLKYLSYKKQEVVLIHILDKEEIEPNMEGHVRLIDSETTETKDVTMSPQILRAYKKHLKEFTTRLEENSKKVGAKYILLSSDETIEKIIFEKFSAKGVV